jgi:predicted phosphodiesterase
VVTGNNDPAEMAPRFGWRRALRWRGWRLGLVHGDVGRGRTTPLKARSAFVEAPPRWEEVVERQAAPAPDPGEPPAGRLSVAPSAVTTAAPEGRPRGILLHGPRAAPFDLIVFGHSHQPHCELVDDVLLLNPGSPTERRREPRASFALLETDGRTLEARFEYL